MRTSDRLPEECREEIRKRKLATAEAVTLLRVIVDEKDALRLYELVLKKQDEILAWVLGEDEA